MARKPPGRLELTSVEVEWLIAHLLFACQLHQAAGNVCNTDDALHRCISKLDNARYPDAVEVLVPNPNAAAIREFVAAVEKRRAAKKRK